MAKRGRPSKKKNNNVYVSEAGLEIEIKQIDPIFIQSVIRSVEMPEVPTYEARTSSGIIEIHPMDKEAAEQTSGGKEIWDKYEEEFTEATLQQTDRSLRAIFLDGTTRPETEWVDQKWLRKMRIIKMDLPTDQDELWVLFLTMNLSPTDIINLSGEIMRLTGVPEEMISAAEDSFLDSVRTTGNDTEESTQPDENSQHTA